MPAWVRSVAKATRLVGESALSLVCWTVWLSLGVLFFLQVAIAVSHELAVPKFVLRAFEARLKASHAQAGFGRATFDPAGGILVENLRLWLPEFSEPVAQADAVFIQLDPWTLLTGRFEPRRVHASGVKLYVPAMLAPSGRNEEIIDDLEFTLVPGPEETELEMLTARLAGVALSVHGSWLDPHIATTDTDGALPLLERLARNYGQLSRRVVRVATELRALEEPRLQITLTPSPTRGAIATVALTARQVDLPAFHDLHAGELTLTTRLPLRGEAPAMSLLNLALRQVRMGQLGSAESVETHLRGVLNPAAMSFRPVALELSAERVSAKGFTVKSLSAQITPQSWTQFDAEVSAECFGLPISASGHVDLTQQTAGLHVRATLSPDLLNPIGDLMKNDLHRFIGFGEPLLLDGDVQFAPAWTFSGIAGHLEMKKIDAYHVAIDRAEGEITFDGHHFLARNAKARIGDNFATGSFEQNLVTREFRFLLGGRLRPLAISGWFREWWPNFFEEFAFPEIPPAASVDVAGRWFSGNETTVFVFADSASPMVRGVHFDQARTRLFIRPYFMDGLELFATRGTGEVRGTFIRRVDLASNDWSEFTLSLLSTLDLEAGVHLLGPQLSNELSPYVFAAAPHVKVEGRFSGPGAVDGPHQTLDLQVESTGTFSAFRFPGQNLSFDAHLKDNELVLENLKAKVAGGTLAAHAILSGTGATRRLGFDASLRGANLSEAVTTLVKYAAFKRGVPQKSTDNILPGQSNVKLDLTLSADGLFDDLYSYKGTGNALLSGDSLGEVRLLGALSALLDFTALHFTAARAEFKVMGPRVIFPAVSVTGSNSAIEGHGEFVLDRRELNFNARVYPFQESKSLFQNMVGLVLTPLSAVFEVKLTGPLDQPAWAFVIGPTNFFRSFSRQPAEPVAPVPQPPAANYLKRKP
jgi:hypothetical protein